MVLQPRIRRLLLWVALPVTVLVLLYAVLGFWLVPRLIRSNAQSFVAEHYHRQLSLGEIRFNPFALKLDIRDLSLPDSDGQPMLSFSHLLVDLTFASLWHLGPDFETILLEQPYARVVIKRDGSLNFGELALPPSPAPKPETNPKPVRLLIHRLSVQGGNVAFQDHAHPSEFATEIKPLNFDLREFSTIGKGGGTYSLSGASEEGERFGWSGSLNSNPLSSHGQFEVAGLKAQTIWSYLRDSVHFELPSGAISLNGEYDFNGATTPIGLSVDVHEVSLTDLGVKPKGGAEDYIKLARLDIKETHADVSKRAVTVGNVHLAGGEIRAWVTAPGKLNLLEMSGPSTPVTSSSSTTTAPAAATLLPVSDPPGATSPPPAAPPTASAPASPPADQTPAAAGEGSPPADNTPWTVSVPDIALDGLKISAEDRQVTPAVVMQLEDLNIHVTGYTTAKTNPVAVTLATKINHTGKFDAKVDLSPDLTGVKAQAELANLDLTAFQPYVARETAMTLRSGLVSTRLNVERGSGGDLTVGGQAELAKLRTVDNVLQQDFIKVERLQVEGIDYRSSPASLHVKSVVARAPYARVIIESDRTVNIKKVLKLKDADQPIGSEESNKGAESEPTKETSAKASKTTKTVCATSATASAASSAEANNQPSAANDGAGSAAAAGAAAGAAAPAETANAAGAAAAVTPPERANKGAAAPSSASAGVGQGKHRHRHASSGTKVTPPSAGGSMAMAIDTIDIENGSANYSDYWIQPHFAVGIQTLQGSIRGLSSEPQARARIELQGKVDRYAPVHIWGETNPLAATGFTDIKMSFKGVEMSTATPYSGHFAGYKIEKGKLSVDIGYKIENRCLTAEHRVVIDQLELGERVESPDAVHLPLKIAIALLKDRNGVIDLNLPVTGSLDDPQFSVGPIIWKAVLNLLGKIATAPFALLGHLFGGGEQMNYIDFAPGSATLDQGAQDKLAALVKALKAKEKLELDVPVVYAADVDRPGLAAAHLNNQLQILRDTQARAHKQAPSDAALTDPAQRYQLLLTLFRAQQGKDASLPDSVQAAEAGKKKNPPPDFGAANSDLEAALLQKMPVADTELESLGRHRARAIQDALLGGGSGIDPSRVFVIGSPDKPVTDKDKVRVELALK